MKQAFRVLLMAAVVLGFCPPRDAGATSAYTEFSAIQALLITASIDRTGAQLLGHERSVGVSKFAVRHIQEHVDLKKLGILILSREPDAWPTGIKRKNVLKINFRISLLETDDGRMFGAITGHRIRSYGRGEVLHQELVPYAPYLFSFESKNNNRENFGYVIEQFLQRVDWQVVKGIKYLFRSQL
ncbi:MAG: hypothetical protein GY947_12430 [Rhodobacteraceae bacterium]|nr:hypothetical protein [Paracoccaceae bacterium]